ACGKQFQFEYARAGCRPAVKQLVLGMLVRNSGIRDIEMVTGVHRQTVLRWLNQKAESLQVEPRLKAYKSVQLDEVGPLWASARSASGGCSTPMRRRQTRYLPGVGETAASTR
ncbi:hypothetical protein ACFS7Z_27280, partial [Pontibacter toksunensis]